MIRVELAEEERQVILLAIARLGLARPGWQSMLRELADAKLAGGAMYDGFQESNRDLVAADELFCRVRGAVLPGDDA